MPHLLPTLSLTLTLHRPHTRSLQEPLELPFSHPLRLRMGRSTLTVQAKRNWMTTLRDALNTGRAGQPQHPTALELQALLSASNAPPQPPAAAGAAAPSSTPAQYAPTPLPAAAVAATAGPAGGYTALPWGGPAEPYPMDPPGTSYAPYATDAAAGAAGRPGAGARGAFRPPPLADAMRMPVATGDGARDRDRDGADGESGVGGPTDLACGTLGNGRGGVIPRSGASPAGGSGGGSGINNAAAVAAPGREGGGLAAAVVEGPLPKLVAPQVRSAPHSLILLSLQQRPALTTLPRSLSPLLPTPT